MDAGRATLIGTVLAALVSLAGALLTRYGKRDDTATERQRLADERRQHDIDRIIDTLQGDVANLRAVVKEHEETIQSLRLENYELRGDRAQLGNEVHRLTARVKDLEGKVS